MKKTIEIIKTVLIFSLLVFFTQEVYSTVFDSKNMDAETSNSNSRNIVEIVESTPDLSTFLQALNASGLTQTLEATGPFTVFAPSNDAFAAMPKSTLQDLLKKENKTKLANILKNHITNGNLSSVSLNTGNINTLGSKPLHIEVHGSQITVDGAIVVESDLTGSNGSIHIIDTVLGTGE